VKGKSEPLVVYLLRRVDRGERRGALHSDG
jgi:hypothetical protein